MQEKQKILDLLHIFLHRFRVASGREMPYTYHTHTIHIPYTYHTHTIPLSMATIWHHREKTEASPCITTTSYMRNGSGDRHPLIYIFGNLAEYFSATWLDFIR